MLAPIGIRLVSRLRFAGTIAFLAALLPFVGLPTAWISVLLVAFITLTRGWEAGFKIMMWVALPALALAVTGDDTLLLGMVGLRVLAVWGLGFLLQRCRGNWGSTIQTASLAVVLGIVMIHLSYPDITQWWENQLSTYWDQLVKHAKHTLSVDPKLILEWMSRFATGIVAVVILSVDLFALALARAWQTFLFYPGEFQRELAQLRVSHGYSVLVFSWVLVAGIGYPIFLDALPVVILPPALAALSLIHLKIASQKSFKLPLIVGLYMIIATCLPYALLLLALIGTADAWCDFRGLKVIKT